MISPAQDQLKSIFLQRAMQGRGVPAIARFNGADRMHRADVRPAERAIVRDVLHARTGARDHPTEFGKSARPVADDRSETRQPAIMHKAFLDHAAQNGWINVSATHDESDAFAS